jgi:(1->4)-alpha-D-glucan 1-alpha-D-glucosylmutase
MTAVEVGASYRLQLRPEFGFDQAIALLPYLAELGISHLYCSPYLQAVGGSTHGYDVVDHGQVNVELGGADGHRRLCAALAEHGMGQILDIVPNHMAAVGPANPWWWDVLENGASSKYAPYFDLDWDSPDAKWRNVVLLPVLGDHYGRVLEAGGLRLMRQGGSFSVGYAEHRAPIALWTLDRQLSAAARTAGSAPLYRLVRSLRHAAGSAGVGVESSHRERERLRRELADLCAHQTTVAATIDDLIEDVNADPDALHELLERQHYRFAYWRIGNRELDYRRFFDVASLVGLRMEDERVFADTHRLVLRWVAEGVLAGIRVDHVDGLRDPAGYLQRLRGSDPDGYLVVEKILREDESLPPWPIDGTTGYDFVNQMGGLFVDPSSEQEFASLYADFTGEDDGFAEVAYQARLEVLDTVLFADLRRLTGLLAAVCEADRRYRDYTDDELMATLREIAANFGVYRTYVGADGHLTVGDRQAIDDAIASSVQRRPDLDETLVQLCRGILLADPDFLGPQIADLRLRFQQLTPAVLAKGTEDTAFYRYVPLLSLNEVGGNPARWGVSVDEFHRWCSQRQRDTPAAMSATSTHDTKRSEDVRARISLLSEMPAAWADAVGSWHLLTAPYRDPVIDASSEYLLYQTLVGAHPLSCERAVAYMEKACREAKRSTSWENPSAPFEAAMARFIEGCLADERFVAALERFVAPLIHPGRVTSLAQTLLKVTAPGVPDFFQGSELWDLTLVDPDNRRPVDFDVRRHLLAAMADGGDAAASLDRGEGLPKLFVIHRALQLRRARPEAFGRHGSYRSLPTTGGRADHAVAFCRGGEAVIVVPRLVLGLDGDWRDTAVVVPPGHWRDQFTGEEVSVPDGPGPTGVALRALLGRFPVALLARVGA